MKTIITTMLMLAALPAHAQWIGAARPMQNDQVVTSSSYSAQARSAPNRRTSNCVDRQRQAMQDLMAAARQGDPRNYSGRLAALAPLHRVNCK